MKPDLIFKRLLELGGLILIADGVLTLFRPRRRSLLWHCGPQLTKAMTEELADHPKTSRAIYAAEIALGLALTSVELPEAD